LGDARKKPGSGWPCSAEIEKLRDTWARATDLAKQKEIAVELQRLLYEVVPYVNFGQWSFPTAYRKSLKGVIVSPVPFFWNITKEG
jgi:peptide/nickel transport system substrate-binding protein